MDDLFKRGGYPTSELFTMILCDLNFVVSYFRYIFTIYSLYILYVFTICSIYVHCMFTMYSLYIQRIIQSGNVTPFLKLPYSEHIVNI